MGEVGSTIVRDNVPRERALISCRGVHWALRTLLCSALKYIGVISVSLMYPLAAQPERCSCWFVPKKQRSSTGKYRLPAPFGGLGVISEALVSHLQDICSTGVHSRARSGLLSPVGVGVLAVPKLCSCLCQGCWRRQHVGTFRDLSFFSPKFILVRRERVTLIPGSTFSKIPVLGRGSREGRRRFPRFWEALF